MIRQRIDSIRSRIAAACRAAGRSPDEVTLLAVSKTFPADAIREAAEAGVADIGENYVQEMLAKREALAEVNIRWHFIGHLQTNKVKYIADWVHLIHAVDNVRLVAELDKRAAQTGRVLDVLIEVNTTGERTKFGVAPEQTAGLISELGKFRNIRSAGLMTIGPFLPDPEGSRPMFQTLRRLREEIRALNIPNATMHHLSMGMTGDFEVAIDEGATIIRIGTAIFGKRTPRD